MEKRDRYINVFLHRKSDTLVLDPGVCYMAGCGTGYGTPVILPLEDLVHREIGGHLLQLFCNCKNADIDAMAAHRKSGLQKFWRGDSVTSDDMHPSAKTPGRSDAVRERFPVMLKGPAAILRAFAWATLLDRDSWKSWKLTQQVNSQYQGAVNDGENIRIPKNATPTKFGSTVLDFMKNC